MTIMAFRSLDELKTAQLKAQTVIPVAVSDIIGGHVPLDGASIAALHEVVSEQPVDVALLGVALSAQDIMESVGTQPEDLTQLSERAVKMFGQAYLEMSDAYFDEGDVMAMPKLFEDLGQALHIFMEQHKDSHPITATVAKILSMQCEPKSMESQMVIDAVISSAPKAPSYTNNIVPFPSM